MASPAMFLSIIAIVMVSVTSLIMVENRSRLSNLKQRVMDTQSEEISNQRKHNYKLDAVVKEINNNNTAMNDKVFELEQRIATNAYDNSTAFSNADLRMIAGDQINSMNYVALSNVMNNRFGDLVSDIANIDNRSRDNTSKMNSNINALTDTTKTLGDQNVTAMNLISTNSNIINSRFDLFSNNIAPRVTDVENSYATLNTDYERYSNVSSNIMKTTNDELAVLTTRLDNAVLEMVNLDERDLTEITNAVNANVTKNQKSINDFFIRGTKQVFPTQNPYTSDYTFDEFMNRSYFTGARTIQNTQAMVDAVERTQGELVRLKQDTVANTSNIMNIEYTSQSLVDDVARLGTTVDNLNTSFNTRLNVIEEEGSSTFATIEDHNSTIEDVATNKASVDAVTSRVDTIDTTLGSMNTTIQANNASIVGLTGRLNLITGTDPDKSFDAVISELLTTTEGRASINSINDDYWLTNFPTKFTTEFDSRMTAGTDGIVTSTNFGDTAQPYMETNMGMKIRTDGGGAFGGPTEYLQVNKKLKGTSEIEAETIKGNFDVVATDAGLGGRVNSLNTIATSVDTLNTKVTGIESMVGPKDGTSDMLITQNTEFSPGKNVTLQESGASGGSLFVPSFSNIKMVNAQGAETTLEQRLQFAANPALAGENISQALNGKRVDVLYTGQSPGNPCTGERCKPIDERLTTLTGDVASLFTRTAELDSTGGYSPVNLVSTTAKITNTLSVFRDVTFADSLSVGGTTTLGSTTTSGLDVSGDLNASGTGTFTALTTTGALLVNTGGGAPLNVKDSIDYHKARLNTHNDQLTELQSKRLTGITKSPGKLEVFSKTGTSGVETSEDIAINEPSGFSMSSVTKYDEADTFEFRHQYDKNGMVSGSNRHDIVVPKKAVFRIERPTSAQSLRVHTFDQANPGAPSTIDINMSGPGLISDLATNEVMKRAPGGDNMFIIGRTALMQKSASGGLKACPYDPGSGTISGECGILWDTVAAPGPEEEGQGYALGRDV